VQNFIAVSASSTKPLPQAFHEEIQARDAQVAIIALHLGHFVEWQHYSFHTP
jgi:hypothetical protein